MFDLYGDLGHLGHLYKTEINPKGPRLMISKGVGAMEHSDRTKDILRLTLYLMLKKNKGEVKKTKKSVNSSLLSVPQNSFYSP